MAFHEAFVGELFFVGDFTLEEAASLGHSVSDAPRVDLPVRLSFVSMGIKHGLVWFELRHYVKGRSTQLDA